jgi:hypothetical protein
VFTLNGNRVSICSSDYFFGACACAIPNLESVLKTIGADVLEARIAALQAPDFTVLIQDKPSNAGVAE